MKPSTQSVNSLGRAKVINKTGKNLGKIEDFVVDLATSRITYAVLSFGSLPNTGNKLFVIPMNALKLDLDNEYFLLDVFNERLEDAPSFDKNNWPDMADPEWRDKVHSFFGIGPYDKNYSFRNW